MSAGAPPCPTPPAATPPAPAASAAAVYYSDVSLRALLRPHRLQRPLLSPRPSQAQDVAYYASAEKRGYLSAEVRRRRRQGRGLPARAHARTPPPFAHSSGATG